ncbi:MAG: hypothetical protein OXS30_08945 [Chloroflexota bacterium]|nr:hypothetical protein [Chloroflexota bacterium]
MPDPEQDTPEVEEGKSQEPDRDFPISSNARFTIGGKPLALEDFIDITTGDVASRPRVEPQPQPEPLPKQVIWNARRPVED